jgi:hypothetical protein
LRGRFYADMIDIRENILQRLIFVCAAIDGIREVRRNRLDVHKLDRPSIAILDGSEQLLDAPMDGRGNSRTDLQRMELSPLIMVHIRSSGSDAGGEAGVLLSKFRSDLLAAILYDAPLLGYVGSNGHIRYEGAMVAPPEAEGFEHRIDLMISFAYQFRPADLL